MKLTLPTCFFNKVFIMPAFVLAVISFYSTNIFAGGTPEKGKSFGLSAALAPSNTSLTASPGPSCFGASVTLTATVTPTVATGLVEFFDGATSLGTSALASGTATFSTSTLSGGSHNLTATYLGDGTYTPSTSAVVVQVVNTIPATPGVITGTTVTCPGATGLIYSITPVAGATSYTWTSPGTGWTPVGVVTNPSITYNLTAAAVSGNILVAAANACGSSAASQVINISPVNAPDNSGYVDLIGAVNTKYSDAITAATQTTPVRRGFIKFPLSALSVIPAGATWVPSLRLTNNGSGISAAANSITGLGIIDPTTASATTLFNAAASGTVYNPGTWGATGTINLPFNAAGISDIQAGVSSPGYLALGLVKSATGGAVANFWGYSAGANVPILSVSYSSLRTLAITVSGAAPATPPAPTGPATVCPASTGNIYTISVPNATSYTWTVTGGLSIASGQGTASVSVNAALTNGTISVTASNSCGSSLAGAAKAVTISALPGVAAAPVTQTLCSGVAITTIALSGSGATSFNWVRTNTTNLTGMPASATGVTDISGTLINNAATQQTTSFSVYGVNSIGCLSASAAVASVTVNPPPIVNAGPDQPGCAAVPITIGGSPTASGGTPGYTYSWSPAAGLSSTSVANPTATPGTYSVLVTDGLGCSASDAITVSTATAGTKTWTGLGSSIGGGVDADFNNPNNWDPIGTPTACNDVVMNMSIFNILNLPFGTVAVTMSANANIKSLAINVNGTAAFSTTGAIFRLEVGSRTLTIAQNTSIITSGDAFVATYAAQTYLSVGAGGFLNFNGNLTTSIVDKGLNHPFYALNNNTGTVYVKGNATLAGIGNEAGNKPARVVFDGTGTQNVNNNSGAQVIHLGSTSTEIGETNSPLVVLGGSGTGGFDTRGNLSINNTATLNLGTTQFLNRNASGGTLSMAAGSLMRVGRNAGGNGASNFPNLFSTYTFNATSTVDYYATANQTIVAAPLYGHLTLSGSGIKTANANINAQSNVSIQGAAVYTPSGAYTTSLGGNWANYNATGFAEGTSIVDFNGAGAQTINTTGGEIFFSLRKSGAGVTTMLSNVTVEGGGLSNFTQSNGTFDAGTLNFYSLNSPLNMSGGLLKLAKTGATVLPDFVNGGFTLSNASTIELYGAGAQILRGARAYRNLTFSASGTKTISSAITSITGTILTQNSVIVDVAANTMGGTGTNLTMTGTSLYKTAGTGTKPDAAGTYILNAGTTIEFTGSAPVTTEDIRLIASNYYNVVVSGNNVANPSAGTGIKIQAGGSFTVKNLGVFKLGSSNGFSGALNTSINNTNAPTIVLENGSTVEYYGGPAGTNPQTITNVIPYQSLTFSGTSVKTAPAGTLTVKGNLNNISSGFAHNNGMLLLDGTAAQNYSSTGTPLNYYNLTATNATGININGDLGVANFLSFGITGKMNFNAGNLSLKSTATYTASIDKISLANSFSYPGTGGFIVERYIPTGIAHGKSWQFLAAPAFGKSLNETWQEGNLTLTPPGAAGLGTTITSDKVNALARKYDFYTPNSGSSIKSFDPASGTWVSADDGVTATTAAPLANPKGYMIFVRGDRFIQASATPANATTLRSKGRLYAPGSDAPPSVVAPAGKFTSIGNPYASAIDFINLRSTSAGLDATFYVWDPLLASALGYGAYQTFTGVTGWIPTPGGTTNYPSTVPVTKLQSGQAAFVFSTPGGTVNFNESNKTTGSQNVYRNANSGELKIFTSGLYNAEGVLIDGNTLALGQDYSAGVDENDATKFSNLSENFGILSNEKTLAVEARPPYTSADTLHYNLTGLRQQSYQLRFSPLNLGHETVEAFLADRFTNTIIPVSLAESTAYDFVVDTDVNAAASNRFYLFFKPFTTVPIASITADVKRTGKSTAEVNWRIAEENNLQQYDVQRSADGRSFMNINTVQPAGNNTVERSYKASDISVPAGDNFYRIAARFADGSVRYSNVTKLAAVQVNPGIEINPNPIAGKVVNLYLNALPDGLYACRILNKLGQTVYRTSINVRGMSVKKEVTLNNQLTAGTYQVILTAPDGKVYTKQFISE